jgi:D-lyxose ketol-isomerase
MNRRTLLKASAVAAVSPALLASGNRPKAAGAETSFNPKNRDFYTNGKFDDEKGKDGVIALCKKFGYPVFPGLREKLWVSDYGIGQFMKVGLAAYMFQNHSGEQDQYMLMDLFLMPGQMLPEHWHEKGDHGTTKDEGWLVRWGTSYIVGIGENNMDQFPQIKVPKCHHGGKTTVFHVVQGKPGSFTPLAKITSRHWQFAGPEGAIITEAANFHTNEVTYHTDATMNKFFLGS